MAVMRYTLIDKSGTISFIAPWNTLKALVAACSRKPAPEDLSTVLEAASRYSSGLREYVFNGLAVFDEHYTTQDEASATRELNPQLERELREILGLGGTGGLTEAPQPAGESEDFIEEEEDISRIFSRVSEEEKSEITYEELLEKQRQLRGAALSRHPVLRVLDDDTRRESLEPVSIGLVIFNLPAKRIIQVQNSYGVLKRSDRGRYFENGQPTERLYFYRLPTDWSLLP
ncbi:MAG: hypothetical protein J0I20_28565 [Chloroflexi bacterium]|nr:hypothetical protein [Chloroflexota bacterium]OJV96838.1 MAG: hypothetical protein BGO39_09050 [Chloroflexi bacterium 54-19]